MTKEWISSMDVLEMVEGSFGLATYEEVKAGLEEGKRRTSFGNDETAPILKDDTFGRVGVLQYFEESQEEFTIMDLESMNEELDLWGIWTERLHDNTYNSNGYMERELNVMVFENEDGECIAFYAVHIGLDVRGGYTKYFPVSYPDYEAFIYHYAERFDIGGASFTVDGVEYTVSLVGCGTSEYIQVWISNRPVGDVDSVQLDDDTYELDLYDKESFVESFPEYLEEKFDLVVDEGSIDVG